MNTSMIAPIKRMLQRMRKWRRWKRRLGFFVLGGLAMAIGGPVIMIGWVWVWFHGRIYPQVTVGGVALGGMTRTEALQQLTAAVTDYQSSYWPLMVTAQEQTFTLTLPENALVYQSEDSVKAAYDRARQGPLSQRLDEAWELAREGTRLPHQIIINNDWMNEVAASLSATLGRPAVNPSVEAVRNPAQVGGYMIATHAGMEGQEFDAVTFTNNLQVALTQLKPPPSELPVIPIGRVANQATLEEARVRAEGFLHKALALTLSGVNKAETQSWQLNGSDLVAFLVVEGGFDRSNIGTYIHGVADSVNRPAQDAKLTFDIEKGKVSEFMPAKDGLAVDEGETTERVVRALSILEHADSVEAVALQVTHTKPATTLTDVNNLGIKELIGHGESTYFHSIPTRVHNVALAASRINGTLVKPGETFSLNAALGDVSAETGYQQAYVIKEGRTQLGDGGGVCQDSTTVFRAALDAGLPITERRGHAYRVGYYEQNAKPGLDATVYAPSPDFKFLNDTPAALLIQAKADSANYKLTVDLYGASDGRKSEISNHVVWDITPPPPDIYQDDPTLKTGVVKQVDWKASGAKAKFDYTVRRDGQEVYKKTFLTVYQPWASVYLRGTQ